MRAPKTAPFFVRGFNGNRKDCSGAAAVAMAVWPGDGIDAANLERDDTSRKSNRICGRVVAERNGVIVATGAYGQETPAQPGAFLLDIMVHPNHRRQGIGAALYEHIIGALSPHRPAILLTDTHESQPDAPGFLQRRGFEIVQRRPVLRLDVRSFDAERFASSGKGCGNQMNIVAALGKLIVTVPDWKRRCWDLDWEIVQDIPSVDTARRPTFESYSQQFQSSLFSPDFWFIALRGDEWIGMSILDPGPAKAGTFYTSVTGVRRPYRRQGVATALKLRGIDHVRASAGRIIETDVEQDNPMLDLNLALGFELGPAILELQKTV